MKYITNFIITALLLFCTDLWAQDHVGFLKKVSGDVEIQRGDSFVNAHKGLQLMNADVLITGSIGYAGVVFTDGTTVTIGPDTEFVIRNYRFNPDVETYDFSMYLKIRICHIQFRKNWKAFSSISKYFYTKGNRGGQGNTVYYKS